RDPRRRRADAHPRAPHHGPLELRARRAARRAARGRAAGRADRRARRAARV
ncbi:MAG: 4-hydroxy-tetrahydrodipicolinate reductase, partial [uncultured Solirubrobacteraceae bacterium]